MADIAADIAAQAVEPVSVTADGQSVTARPLTEQITAQQFADQRAAGRKRRRGIASTILTTPGASGICSTGGFSNPGGY